MASYGSQTSSCAGSWSGRGTIIVLSNVRSYGSTGLLRFLAVRKHFSRHWLTAVGVAKSSSLALYCSAAFFHSPAEDRCETDRGQHRTLQAMTV